MGKNRVKEYNTMDKLITPGRRSLHTSYINAVIELAN